MNGLQLRNANYTEIDAEMTSSDFMSEAMHEGVLLVPIGSKFSSSKDNNYEWRFSFSRTKKLLVHLFKHGQLFCYVLLKIF